MHILDCQLVVGDNTVLTGSAELTEVESRVENSQGLNILLEEVEKKKPYSSDDELTSVSSHESVTTDEDSDEDIEEVMLEYSMAVLDTEEEDESGGDEENVKEQEKEEEKEATTEVELSCDYIDVLRYLDEKEKQEIEKVVEEARIRITEVEGKMARYQQEMNAVNKEFEEEKLKMIKIVKEKHVQMEKKNESILMMKEVIKGMTTNLDESNSLLEKRNDQVNKMKEEMNKNNRRFWKKKTLEKELENLSQVQTEKTRMKNEIKVLKRKEGEEEVSLKDFHQDYQNFKTLVLSQLKQREKNEKEKEKEKQGLDEIAPWAAHSNGFASKYMQMQGHQPGKGLGKTADGIVKPISAEKRTFARDISPHSTWPKNTVLIAGDSMIGGLEEKRMSRKYNVKVRSHPGATTHDMCDHLNALLRKKPDHLIIHAHTNDATDVDTSADDIFDRLTDMKALAESLVPDIKVTLSCPIVRSDNGVANAKLLQVRNRLKRSGVSLIDNDSITYEDLSRKGLHLKPCGTRKLAANMIAHMRSL
jgi:myosin heavy subunit